MSHPVAMLYTYAAFVVLARMTLASKSHHYIYAALGLLLFPLVSLYLRLTISLHRMFGVPDALSFRQHPALFQLVILAAAVLTLWLLSMAISRAWSRRPR